MSPFPIQGQFNTIGTAKFLIENSGGTGIQLLGNSGVELGTVLNNVLAEGTQANYGVGIDVDAAISDCRITAHFKNVLTGIDFSGGSIGNRNTIRVTGDGENTHLVVLPASIDASNEIVIQGMRVKGRTSTVANNGSGDYRVTSANHGLSTNDKIAIDGVRGVTGLNSTSYGHVRTVTKIDDNTFDVNDTTVSGTHVSNTGWWGVWQK